MSCETIGEGLTAADVAQWRVQHPDHTTLQIAPETPQEAEERVRAYMEREAENAPKVAFNRITAVAYFIWAGAWVAAAFTLRPLWLISVLAMVAIWGGWHIFERNLKELRHF